METTKFFSFIDRSIDALMHQSMDRSVRMSVDRSVNPMSTANLMYCTVLALSHTD